MTSTEPPEEEFPPGTELKPIPGYRLPERDNLAGLKDAVLFVPMAWIRPRLSPSKCGR